MDKQWPATVIEKLALLAQLPQVRYAFIPGFNRNPTGNSSPGAHLVEHDGELALISILNRTPEQLRVVFDGYNLGLTVDANGYICVQGTDRDGNIRELAPALPAYYERDDEKTHRLIRDNFTPTERASS